MSSFAYLYVNNEEVFSWRNSLDHSIMSLFSKEDLIEAAGNEAIKIVKNRNLKTYEGYEEDADNFSIMLFARNAKELKDRLNVLGYNETSFKLFLQEVTKDELEPLSQTLDEDFDKYRAEKQEQTLKLINNYISGRELSKENVAELLELLECDPCFALYYKIKDAEDDAQVTLDISEFAYDGWFDDSVLELNQVAENIQRSTTPPIVLTEGVFDRKVLKDSIELLYPHLKKYVKFLDIDYKTEGGAGALVKTLKSFAAAGISNRIIAIFDNDTAAHEALSAINTGMLPSNYRIMHYPNIELGNNYPTLGPQGSVEMNINGLAGAIELYLGNDSLKDEAGNLRHVQWTGYASKLGKYQGEILGKSKVQQSFLNKLKMAQLRPSLISEQDWSGIRLIIDSLIKNLAEV